MGYHISVMRILIVRPGALGDTIMAEPLVRAMAGWKNIGLPGEVVVVGTVPQNKMIGADRSIDVDGLNLGAFFEPEGTLDPKAAEDLSNFDLAISFWGEGYDEFSANLERIGCRSTAGRPAFPAEGSGVHAIDHMLSVCAEMKVAVVSTVPQIPVPEEWRESGLAKLSEVGASPGKFLAVHPGASSFEKCWDASGMVWVARECEKNLGLKTVMVRGPADAGPASSFMEVYGGGLSFINMPTLPELAGILSQAKAYVGNDSGVTHLAAAVNVPTAAVFFASDPSMWAPRGPNVRVVNPTGLSSSAGVVLDAIKELIGTG